MADRIRATTVTIADSATTSGAFATSGEVVVGLITPSGWDTQNITFEVSVDGTNYFGVWDVGSTDEDAAFTITSAVASRYHAIPPYLLAGAKHVKVVSGAAQSGAVDITLVTRQVA